MKIKVTKNILKNKIKNIKLLATDVDGVLTDGGMYYSNDGKEFKKFNVRDGMGISMLRKSGVKVAIVTLEDTAIVENRAKKLNITDVFLGSRDKVKSIEILLKRYNLQWENVSFIGDDINDFEVLKKVGLAVTPNDGINENKKIAHLITSKNGGDGCVRELCDLILKTQKESK